MIITTLSAQMGNQMFMYANAYALARETGQKLAVYKFDYTLIYTLHRKWAYFLDDLKLDAYNRYMGIPLTLYKESIRYTLQKLMNKKDVRPVNYKQKDLDFIEDRVHVYTPVHLDRTKEKHLLKGFFQSAQYFDKYREDILRQFVPAFELSAETKLVLKEIENSAYPVSVHIRRGDYVALGACLPLAYYHDAVAMVKEEHPEARFFIFSNDIAWVKENLKLEGSEAFYVEHKQDVRPFEDIWSMSKCTTIIIANSTYGWGGGYLNTCGEKCVIVPDCIKRATNRSIIPEGWKVMNY